MGISFLVVSGSHLLSLVFWDVGPIVFDVVDAGQVFLVSGVRGQLARLVLFSFLCVRVCVCVDVLVLVCAFVYVGVLPNAL